MLPDLSPYFERYRELVAGVDSIFSQIEKKFPECVKCHNGCSDCCNAMFDLSLIEAIYLNSHFNSLDEAVRNELLLKADKADRKAFKMKKELYRASEAGAETEELLKKAGQLRLRCPLLGEDNKCSMYEHRPLTCRAYGIPLQIGEQSMTCGLSAFETGVQYPVLKMEALYARLGELSAETAAFLNSSYSELASLMIPVSSALLTVFDDEYLGIGRKISNGSESEADTSGVNSSGEEV